MVGMGTECLEHCLDVSALRGDPLGDVEQHGPLFGGGVCLGRPVAGESGY